MTTALDTAALLVTGAALLCSAVVLVTGRSVTTALPVLLDMLLAASLLRLAQQPTPAQLAGTALLVVVKRLASIGLRRASGLRRPPVSRDVLDAFAGPAFRSRRQG